MASKVWASCNEAVRRFVHTDLLPHILSSNIARIDIARAFSIFLQRNGAPRLIADERTDKWVQHLLRYIERRLSEWEALGVPRPLEMTEDSRTAITWRHPMYEAITGREPLAENYSDIDNWIRSQTDSSFLLVAAIFLKLIGADRIFVTDESGDVGVDLIGRVREGPLRSTFFFIQAKSASSPEALIKRDALLLNYGKFSAFKNQSRFNAYKAALDLDQSPDGADLCYIFMTNTEFMPGTRNAAVNLGILLRSRKQISHFFSKEIDVHKLQQMERDLVGRLRADLNLNLASKIVT